MPQMTKRWRTAAWILAVLAFISIAQRLVVRQYEPTTTGCSAAPYCFREVTFDPVTTLLIAALNAGIWFGIVYLVFLVVWSLRRLFSKMQDPTKQ